MEAINSYHTRSPAVSDPELADIRSVFEATAGGVFGDTPPSLTTPPKGGVERKGGDPPPKDFPPLDLP